MPKTYQTPDLNNRRDNVLLRHVARNFITRRKLATPLFFEGVRADAARKVFARLVRERYLNEFPLHGRESYYRLGSKAVQLWRYPRSRTEALGPQRLPYELGTLDFMCGAPVRKRLLASELSSLLPWFPDSLMNWAYFVEGDSLGTVRVEIRSRPQRIIEKLEGQLYEACGHPEFRSLLEGGRFFMVVITASEMQQIALEEARDESSFSTRLDVYHNDELATFL